MAKTTGFRRSGGRAARGLGTGKIGFLSYHAPRPKKNAPVRKRDVVEVPRADFEALIRRIENLEDVRAIEEARADPDREELPVEMVVRLLGGKDSRVVVWREHRGLTQRALAEKAGVQQGYLSEIESGKKPGSVDALAKIARALDVQIDDLVG
jgi:DNA-binding XRE family transcriptional regulator